MVLIVIDGTDGSGKATHTKMLLERLEKEGHETFTMSFPTYGKPSCKGVEMYLNGEFGSADEVGPYFASMFYAFNRKEEVQPIKDALKEGKVVVLNRYVSSNMGHQAGKISDPEERNKYLQWVLELEFEIFNLPKPDCTIFVHMPPEIGQEFVLKKRSDREYIKDAPRDMHEEDLEHLKNAEAAYLHASKQYGWNVVECALNTPTGTAPEERVLSLQMINDEVYAIVKPLLK